MAYRKKNFRVKRKPRSAGGKALKMVRSLKRSLKPELKYFDTTSSTNVSTSPSIIDFNLIPQGDTVINREGNQIQPRFLEFKSYLYRDIDATITFCRIIFFRAINNQAVTPSWSDVLQTNNVNSPYENTMRKRFEILSDKRFSLIAGNSDGYLFSNRLKLTARPIRYFGSGTGTPETYGIYGLLLSTEALNYPVCVWYNRMNFTDV